MSVEEMIKNLEACSSRQCLMCSLITMKEKNRDCREYLMEESHDMIQGLYDFFCTNSDEELSDYYKT